MHKIQIPLTDSPLPKIILQNLHYLTEFYNFQNRYDWVVVLKDFIPFCTSGGRVCLMEGQQKGLLSWCQETSQITDRPLLFHTCINITLQKEKCEGMFSCLAGTI